MGNQHQNPNPSIHPKSRPTSIKLDRLIIIFGRLRRRPLAAYERPESNRIESIRFRGSGRSNAANACESIGWIDRSVDRFARRFDQTTTTAIRIDSIHAFPFFPYIHTQHVHVHTRIHPFIQPPPNHIRTPLPGPSFHPLPPFSPPPKPPPLPTLAPRPYSSSRRGTDCCRLRSQRTPPVFP